MSASGPKSEKAALQNELVAALKKKGATAATHTAETEKEAANVKKSEGEIAGEILAHIEAIKKQISDENMAKINSIANADAKKVACGQSFNALEEGLIKDCRSLVKDITSRQLQNSLLQAIDQAELDVIIKLGMESTPLGVARMKELNPMPPQAPDVKQQPVEPQIDPKIIQALADAKSFAQEYAGYLSKTKEYKTVKDHIEYMKKDHAISLFHSDPSKTEIAVEQLHSDLEAAITMLDNVSASIDDKIATANKIKKRLDESHLKTDKKGVDMHPSTDATGLTQDKWKKEFDKNSLNIHKVMRRYVTGLADEKYAGMTRLTTIVNNLPMPKTLSPKAGK